jgi:hypothetical protein
MPFCHSFHWVRGRYKLSKEISKLFSLGERTTQVVEGCFKLTFQFGTLDEQNFVTMDLQFRKFLIQVRNAYCSLNVKIDHVGLLSHGISKSSTFT